jgi:hypothetical protein
MHAFSVSGDQALDLHALSPILSKVTVFWVPARPLDENWRGIGDAENVGVVVIGVVASDVCLNAWKELLQWSLDVTESFLNGSHLQGTGAVRT